MSLIEPEELRYGSISMFGLIIMSTLLDWTDLGSKYEPTKPSTSNVTQVGDRSALDQMMDPDIGGGASAIDTMIDIILTPIQFPINMLIQWSNVWDAMGMMSVFIIVPMMIMMFILAGILVKVVSMILP